MSPAIKYTAGRIGLFAVIFLAMWMIEMNLFVKLIIALAASAVLSFFLLRTWRDQTANQLAAAADRRKAEKAKLRTALAGEDADGTLASNHDSGTTDPSANPDPSANSGPTHPSTDTATSHHASDSGSTYSSPDSGAPSHSSTP